ncbi:OmpH family outer membrane protein [Acidipila sp. EB88]|uniref:OmpH family outer membrane protein n=1 Tax=Acidipila sp. EB88 TaxID=2305226 RepID=UPI000F5FDF18|nr:OmpH family outer membrane protein [Acidipila sp. EB88]RRA47928.1 OmpH family outer membrane protein [Acidipila sp. EB88]
MKLSLSLASLLATGLISSAALAQGTATAAAPAASTASTAAAPAGPAKVAIIMFQAAVSQTNEGKRDLEEVEKKYQPKQAQLKAQSDEIDALKKQLQTQSATLTDVDRAQKLKLIDDKEKSLQRAGEDAQNDFQQEAQQTFAGVAQKFYGTLQAYAQQNGYTLVLDAGQQQSPVLYTNQGNDITEAVIAAYNQKSGIAAPPPSAPTPTGTTPARRAPAAH